MKILLADLNQAKVCPVIIVDDGSSEAYRHIFVSAEIISPSSRCAALEKPTPVFSLCTAASTMFSAWSPIRSISFTTWNSAPMLFKSSIGRVDRMGSLANENLNRAMNALITLDQDEINEVYEVEKNIDFLSHLLVNCLLQISDILHMLFCALDEHLEGEPQNRIGNERGRL